MPKFSSADHLHFNLLVVSFHVSKLSGTFILFFRRLSFILLFLSRAGPFDSYPHKDCKGTKHLEAAESGQLLGMDSSATSLLFFTVTVAVLRSALSTSIRCCVFCLHIYFIYCATQIRPPSFFLLPYFSYPLFPFPKPRSPLLALHVT